MAYSTIVQENRGSVCWIRLAREQQMNSLNGAMADELLQAINVAEQDPACRVVVLTGSGAAFCAGADLKAVLSSLEEREAHGDRADFLDQVAHFFSTLRTLDMPVICGLNGATVAGGLELALCCDLIVASSSAKIGDAHSNFGMFPGGGGASVLPERIGLANARYLLYTGDSLPAARMRDMGLVQEVVADNELDARLDELSTQLAAKSPLVLRQMKHVSATAMRVPQQEALQLEMQTLRKHLLSEDAQEGLRAFREKRTPEFTGR